MEATGGARVDQPLLRILKTARQEPRPTMADPLVLEINTRCWLHGLSETANAAITLNTVPEEEFGQWRRLGFTHVWLMGVWRTGPRSEAAAQSQLYLQNLCDESFGSHDRKIAASPYSIANYTVSPAYGGEVGLFTFREKLRQHGLRLLLDFVPNHVGLDHPWLTNHPEYLVTSLEERPGCFYHQTVDGPRWMAHGKDPYFAPWSDTAQIEFRNPVTHDALITVLESIAEKCDGVRCDMAMLPLKAVFQETWKDFSSPNGSFEQEFWPEAIAAVKQSHPEFLFLAEAYWNLELALQGLGFDYTYDKIFRDYLVRRDPESLEKHLKSLSSNRSMTRFLENHDETPVASFLSLADHRNALQLLLSLPGMRLIYYNQLKGRALHTPVQLVQYRPETTHPEIEAMYEEMLAAIR